MKPGKSNTLLKTSVWATKSSLNTPLESIPENTKFGASALNFTKPASDTYDVVIEGEVIINDELFFKNAMTRDYSSLTDLQLVGVGLTLINSNNLILK
jgi:Leucine-rich repeat (LRR) protein